VVDSLEGPTVCRLLCRLAFVLSLCLLPPLSRAEPPPALHEGKTLSAWIEQLHADKAIPREEACRVLARLGPGAKPAVPALIKLLGREDEDVTQFLAARVLGAVGPDAREAVPALLRALLSPERRNQEEILKALDRIVPEEPKPAVPFLRETLKDRAAGERRRYAAGCLGLLGPRATDALPELAAASDDPDPTLRVYAAEALWRVEKSKHSVPILLDVLKARDEEDGHARSQAAQALGRLGPQAPGVVAALAEVVRDRKRKYDCGGALEALGSPP